MKTKLRALFVAPAKVPVVYYPTLLAVAVLAFAVAFWIVRGFGDLGGFAVDALSDKTGWSLMGIVGIGPIVLMYVLGLIAFGLGAMAVEYVLLRKMRQWNVGAIITATILTPLLAFLVAGIIVQDPAVAGMAVTALGVTYAVFGIATYNDCRYRKRKMTL